MDKSDVLTLWFILAAEAFGLPFINAYLDSVGTNFSHGINFATAASTIRLPISVIPNGGFSPFYLGLQYSQFEQFKVRSQMIRKQGQYIFQVAFYYLKNDLGL